MSLCRERWMSLWSRLGLRGSPERHFRRLRRAHAQWWRAYHNAEHVAECLAWLDEVHGAEPGALQDSDVVEFAFWFHDAIYVPWLPNNEERSARWAVKVSTGSGLDPERVEKVRRLILATLHQAVPEPGDARWMVDIDLAILGADEERFGQYERQIRKEYRWVRAARYRHARASVLRSFLDRERIFSTAFFHHRLESRARRNLETSLKSHVG